MTNLSTRWTRDELILALYAYCKVPFNRVTNTNPTVRHIAQISGRSIAAVKMKIGNFGSFDPELSAKGITGLANASALDKEVWEESSSDWNAFSAKAIELLNQYEKSYLLAHGDENNAADFLTFPQGKEVERTVMVRMNQSFFRDCILASFNQTCCISGIAVPELLEAAHIIPWAENEQLRTDPHNGLCLNPFFHKAFDRYLISVSPDFRLEISPSLLDNISEKYFREYLTQRKGQSISTPERFLPKREYLEAHHQKFLNSL